MDEEPTDVAEAAGTVIDDTWGSDDEEMGELRLSGRSGEWDGAWLEASADETASEDLSLAAIDTPPPELASVTDSDLDSTAPPAEAAGWEPLRWREELASEEERSAALLSVLAKVQRRVRFAGPPLLPPSRMRQLEGESAAAGRARLSALLEQLSEEAERRAAVEELHHAYHALWLRRMDGADDGLSATLPPPSTVRSARTRRSAAHTSTAASRGREQHVPVDDDGRELSQHELYRRELVKRRAAKLERERLRKRQAEAREAQVRAEIRARFESRHRRAKQRRESIGK
eukprot:PLAT14572.1.p1 GENE.PLAT14572.1~~PLAT14572.1.p1  ORF type:complete len:295 (-),score=78.51 PLAT14572.1:42-905(-)